MSAETCHLIEGICGFAQAGIGIVTILIWRSARRDMRRTRAIMQKTREGLAATHPRQGVR